MVRKSHFKLKRARGYIRTEGQGRAWIGCLMSVEANGGQGGRRSSQGLVSWGSDQEVGVRASGRVCVSEESPS